MNNTAEIDAAKEAAIDRFWATGNAGDFESRHASSRGRVNIHYRVFEQADQKSAVVISSGRTECMFKYDETIYDLFRKGYSVYIHDHRGQGFSGATTRGERDSAHGHGPGHVEKFNYYVDDLHDFVTQVVQPAQRRLSGTDKDLFLLAHSMGGGIASLYIEKHRRVFKAAALCSPMHEPDLGLLPGIAVESLAGLKELKGAQEDYARGGGPYDKTDFHPKTAKKSAMTHSPQRYERVRSAFEKHKNTRVGGASYGWVGQAIDAAEYARRHSGDIEIDVLLLQATEDVAVTADGQNEFCNTLNASHPGRCTLYPVEGAYHELMVESDLYRDKALLQISGFFEKHR